MSFNDHYNLDDFSDEAGAYFADMMSWGPDWMELERDGYGHIVGIRRAVVHDHDTICRRAGRVAKVPGSSKYPFFSHYGDPRA